MDNSEEEKIDFGKLAWVVFFELILGLFCLIISTIFLMMFVGMDRFGDDKPGLGTKAIGVFFILLPILVPTWINLRKIHYAVKNKNDNKLKFYKIVQTILTFAYILAVIFFSTCIT